MNSEIFVFGGYNTSYNRRKQVNSNLWLIAGCNSPPYSISRSRKLLAVNWSELVILIMNSTWERVEHTIIQRKEYCCAFQIQKGHGVKGWWIFNRSRVLEYIDLAIIEMFFIIKLIQNTNTIKQHWQNLMKLHWLLVDTVQTPTRLKSLILPATHGTKLLIIHIMNSMFLTFKGYNKGL